MINGCFPLLNKGKGWLKDKKTKRLSRIETALLIEVKKNF